ncbi:hypothetical protein [Ferrimonas kyonanensis]|uniref:hypothetical protein n=1 Tax=Ferrimonas kyonanensis TaxID=364763 RepID=UPI00040D8971|nr:hypothetical protein [Ferrimonas kyonanensis]
MSSSLKKLKKLAKAGRTATAKPTRILPGPSPQVRSELLAITQDAGLSAARELMSPLNPLLSWFNEGGNLTFRPMNSTAQAPQSRAVTNNLSLARLPLKSPPCKRCPARMGGICNCARKKFAL